jgi:drug/metabolite transporter (DMT)-like permease
MLLVFIPRHGIKKLVSTQRLGLQLLRSIMMLIMPVSFIVATEYMSVGNILTLFWLSPFMIMALSMFLLKEKAAWQYWAISFVGLICIVIITNPSRSITTTGIILSLAMGLSFSLYLVMTRMLREESTLTNLLYTASGVLIPLSLRLPTFWKTLTLQSGLMMVLIGLLGFVLLWILDEALEMTSAIFVAPFLYSQMFWMIVLRLVLRVL